METTRTSPPTTSTELARLPAASARGFTLIELLIVVAIIALMAMVAIPSFNSVFMISLDSVSREFADNVRETYNATIVTGRVHRIVYDLKNQQYWVETGPQTLLLDTADTLKQAKERERFKMPDDKPPPNPFSMDKTITRKKIALPRGVEFKDIVTQQSKDPIVDGTTYTHFFPHGMTEQTIVHLVDSDKHEISLSVAPLGGHTDLFSKYVKGDEVFGK